MRTVTITIESSEGPALNIRKRFIDGVIEVGVWRGSDPSPATIITQSHNEALEVMGEAASKFVKEIG